MFPRCMLGLPLLLSAACSSATEPSAYLWEGNLQPVAPSAITGPVAAVAQGGRTRVSIEIRQAVAGQTYAWRLDEGTCPAGGEILGGVALYPSLVAGVARGATAEASLPGQLSSGGRYAARVLGTGAAADVLVACADLALTSTKDAG